MTNRITPYEAGWLTFLVTSGIATEAAAREAMRRVAQDAVLELERRREEERKARRQARRKRREEE